MNPIRGVAFDLDGLLIDSESLWAEIHQTVFSRYGIQFTDEHHMEHYIETSSGTEAVLRRYGLQEHLEEVRQEMNRMRMSYTPKIKLMEGAPELIDALYPYFPLCIVTYSSREPAEDTCNRLNITAKLKFMVTRFDIQNQKPHPEPYLKAAELLGAMPEECVAFEDAPKGVISAKKAGMKCIAVPNRWTEDGDFSCADLVVKSLSDVTLEVLENV